jgi:hypothetical protein
VFQKYSKDKSHFLGEPMDLTVILQVAIGMMFIWILLAMITSAVSDWISQLFKWRANLLEESIRNILVDDKLAEQFYTHPLIKALHSAGGKRKPAEIPNRQFASVVFDMLMKAGTKESVVNENKGIYDNLKASVEKLKKLEEGTPAKKPAPNPGFWQKIMGFFSKPKEKIVEDKPKDLSSISVEVIPNNMSSLAVVLDTLWIDLEKGDEEMGQARKRLETWFDDAMKRLGGAYKRKAQIACLVIGIVLAFALNADALAIANKLWTEPLVRQAVVAQADKFQLPTDQQGQAPQTKAMEYINQLQEFSLPIGWTPDNIPARLNADGTVNKNFGSNWLLKLGGILLSGVGAAQGAPFWFDLMRKLLNFQPGGSEKKEDGK